MYKEFSMSEFGAWFPEEKEKTSPFRWLSLSKIDKWVPLMRQRKVSEVARSPQGFLTAYRRADGNRSQLSEEWWRRRNAFIERHKAQLDGNKEPLFVERRVDGEMKRVPTDRHLALIAWAYSPVPGRI